MMNDLIESIRKQLNIPKSDNGDWICQVIYSVAGQLALASLWDHHENENTVSIQHFKNRITQVFEAYEDIYPQSKLVFPRDKGILIEDMFSIFMRNGFFYHSAYQISPSIPCEAGYGNLLLHRGFSPEAKLFMSGLGFYSVRKESSSCAVSDMFCLQKQSFESYLDELLSSGQWTSIDWPDNTEFLRLDPPFSKGYWQQIPGKDHRISLARYGEPNKLYVFYRYHDVAFQQITIPEWRIRSYYSNDATQGEYRRIATAILKRYGTLPEIKAKIIGDIVEVRVGYRLPPSEEEFFRLYSWPVRYEFSEQDPQVFVRRMTKQFYSLFKHELISLGYCFAEE